MGHSGRPTSVHACFEGASEAEVGEVTLHDKHFLPKVVGKGAVGTRIHAGLEAQEACVVAGVRIERQDLLPDPVYFPASRAPLALWDMELVFRLRHSVSF